MMMGGVGHGCCRTSTPITRRAVASRDDAAVNGRFTEFDANTEKAPARRVPGAVGGDHQADRGAGVPFLDPAMRDRLAELTTALARLSPISTRTPMAGFRRRLAASRPGPDRE
jgi:hypothetical protein